MTPEFVLQGFVESFESLEEWCGEHIILGGATLKEGLRGSAEPYWGRKYAIVLIDLIDDTSGVVNLFLNEEDENPSGTFKVQMVPV